MKDSVSAPPHLVDRANEQLAAIVQTSDDAILTKDLNGIITSWNAGAERIFGYSAAEAVGQSITMLIPADRQDEEPRILARIRAGERVDHYETVRQRRDGSLIHISLTVSPLKEENGRIVGASKIARDITAQKRAQEKQEKQELLLQEMRHRIKNLFSLANSLVALSARSASTPAEVATMVQGRLLALARAHELTFAPQPDRADAGGEITLHELLRTIVSPHLHGPDKAQLAVSGEDLPLSALAVTPVALVLNELATNAAKHGALSEMGGSVSFTSAHDRDSLVLSWVEECDGATLHEPKRFGFGTRITKLTVEGQLDGSVDREWTPRGLSVRVVVPASRIIADAAR